MKLRFKNLKYLAEIKKNISDDKINRSMEKMGLDPNDRRKYKKYSLGMKQRLGIIQAIMEDPDLLILDEPTNALDSDGIMELNQLLIELKNKGKTILISNHDREELELISDEVFTISKGKIVTRIGIGD